MNENGKLVSSRVSARPEILTSPIFTYPPSPKKATPLKILENLNPTLKHTLIQKSEDSFFKEAKYFITNNEIRTNLNVEIWIYSCKS